MASPYVLCSHMSSSSHPNITCSVVFHYIALTSMYDLNVESFFQNIISDHSTNLFLFLITRVALILKYPVPAC